MESLIEEYKRLSKKERNSEENKRFVGLEIALEVFLGNKFWEVKYGE